MKKSFSFFFLSTISILFSSSELDESFFFLTQTLQRQIQNNALQHFIYLLRQSFVQNAQTLSCYLFMHLSFLFVHLLHPVTVFFGQLIMHLQVATGQPITQRPTFLKQLPIELQPDLPQEAHYYAVAAQPALPHWAQFVTQDPKHFAAPQIQLAAPLAALQIHLPVA
jgi:hypothetical protein